MACRTSGPRAYPWTSILDNVVDQAINFPAAVGPKLLCSMRDLEGGCKCDSDEADNVQLNIAINGYGQNPPK